MRCKGPARAIDQVAMHADLKQLEPWLDLCGTEVMQNLNEFEALP